MNPSYFRILQPMQQAMQRLSSWLDLPELEPPIEIDATDAVRLACNEQGQWRGLAFFVYESGDWTVFEELSGQFGYRADSWLHFAGRDDFVYAGYNSAIQYGQLIIIEEGKVVREFIHVADSPEANVDKGKLPGEDETPIETWVQVASFVDRDRVLRTDRGLLWILGEAA